MNLEAAFASRSVTGVLANFPSARVSANLSGFVGAYVRSGWRLRCQWHTSATYRTASSAGAQTRRGTGGAY